MLSKLAEIVIGGTLVALMITDVFQTVIVPRNVGRRLRASAYLSRFLWAATTRLTGRIAEATRRESVLGQHAPFVLVCTMIMWITLLIFGYGLIFYGLRSSIRPLPTLGDALYFAGTSLLTIGYGDVVATRGPARVFAILSGATGFAVVAIVTSYLFAIFGSFQQREVFIVTLGTRSGSPPSGVELLIAHAKLGLMDQLGGVFKDGQVWTAQVMESHLAYPILPYFRSSHDYESWVAALGTLLDAATLLITTVRDHPSGEARLMHALGRHAVHDLGRYFGIAAGEGAGIERTEFEKARDRLARAGLPCRDADEAWGAFAILRATYAARLNGLARYFDIPPAQWVGDRSLLAMEHRALSPEVMAAMSH